MRGAAGRGRCIAVALGVAWGHAATAAAEAPLRDVRWNGPAECPADAFDDALDRLLAGSSLAEPIRVDATVERTDGGWSLHAEFDAGPGRAGQRTFEAAACRTVTQAAALAIAIAVDPGVLDRWVPMADELPEAAAPPGPALPEPEASAVEPAEPATPIGPIEAAASTPAAAEPAAREPSSRWRGLLGVAGTLDGGALPGVGLGVAAALGVLHGRFRGEVVGSRRFATRRAAAADPRVGGTFTQWWVGARGCGVPRLGPVELPLCAGFDGGRTIGKGTGTDLRARHTTPQPWWAVVAEAGLAWPVRPWLALTARATLAVPLVRQTFSIAGLGDVHRVGPVQGRGALGLELRWP